MQNSATGINSIHGENNLGFYERLPNIKAADTLKILNEGEPPVVTVTELENGAKRYTVTFPKTTIDGPELHDIVDTMLHLRHRIGRIVMPFDSKSNALRVNMADWRGPQFIPDHAKYAGDKNWEVVARHAKEWSTILDEFVTMPQGEIDQIAPVLDLRITLEDILDQGILEEYYTYYSTPDNKRGDFPADTTGKLFMAYLRAKTHDKGIERATDVAAMNMKTLLEGDLSYIFSLELSGATGLVTNQDLKGLERYFRKHPNEYNTLSLEFLARLGATTSPAFLLRNLLILKYDAHLPEIKFNLNDDCYNFLNPESINEAYEIPDLGKVSVIDNKTIKVGDRLYMILWDPENNSFFIRKGTQKITPVISFDVDSQGNYKWNFDTTEGDALAGMLLWTYLHRGTTCQNIPDKLEMEITSRAGEKRKVTQEIKAAQMPLLATMMGDFILEKTKQDLALLVG